MSIYEVVEQEECFVEVKDQISIFLFDNCAIKAI
jgi:hypothetical protein